MPEEARLEEGAEGCRHHHLVEVAALLPDPVAEVA
jgi:hypothetical protein